MKKYIFFDIDGTLTVNKYGDGEITEETKKTISSLQKNGHFVAIATGRSYSMAKKYGDMIGVSNYVINGGYGVVIDGKVVENEPLDKMCCIKICEEAKDKGLGVAVVVDDSLNYHCDDDVFVKKSKDSLCSMSLNRHKEVDFTDLKEYHKIYVSVSEDEEEMLESRHLIPYMRYTDSTIVFEGADKYYGVEKMMKIIDGPVEQIVVFGDGKNDLTMFEKSQLSIAMGDAVPDLLNIADFITKSSKDDGITYACSLFGWI